MCSSKRIKELRLKNGLTQEELADKLGLKKSAIAKYENGRVENIKRSIIQKMSNIFDCSPAYLMGWDELNSNSLELSELEKQLVINFRKADEFDKTIVLRTLELDRSLTEAAAGANEKLA